MSTPGFGVYDEHARVWGLCQEQVSATGFGIYVIFGGSIAPSAEELWMTRKRRFYGPLFLLLSAMFSWRIKMAVQYCSYLKRNGTIQRP